MLRWLVWTVFVVVQTMTPFVHVHATPIHHDHAGFLHLHVPAAQDVAESPHTPALEVARGILPRAGMDAAIAPAHPTPLAPSWTRLPVSSWHATRPDSPDAPPDPRFLRLPPALAPPAA